MDMHEWGWWRLSRYSGSELALRAIACELGPSLFELLPDLSNTMFAALETAAKSFDAGATASIITALQTTETLADAMHAEAAVQCVARLPLLVSALQLPCAAVRHMAARALAAFAAVPVRKFAYSGIH